MALTTNKLKILEPRVGMPPVRHMVDRPSCIRAASFTVTAASSPDCRPNVLLPKLSLEVLLIGGLAFPRSNLKLHN